MNAGLFLLARWNQIRASRAKRKYLHAFESPEPEITRQDWKASLEDPAAFYARCFRYFHRRLPQELCEHRKYFTKARRGFGEDAFHVMWFLLDQEFKPRNFLEIGVYRGQVLSFVSLLQQRGGQGGEVVGISPFLPVGDSVSRYRDGLDYYEDTLLHFQHFSLPKPTLFRGFSTDPASMELIASRAWDCIYIDGNHDYDVALADWNACAKSVKPKGLIVLDDSGLTTSYEPPIFSTKGHPGPSKVAQEVDCTQFTEILQVGHNRVFQKLR